VEQIIVKGRKEGKNAPSPVSYDPAPSFGKTGIAYTAAQKLDRQGMREEQFSDYYLQQQKKLPGPGYYSSVNTVGLRIGDSTMTNSRWAEIPKAKDRFKAPTVKLKSPSPDRYQPRGDLGRDVLSWMNKAPVPKFRHDTSDILDMHF